uniref:Cytochrome P450 n=1 Tax=Kalanchoe fedtschenkoi TaxID=63787 RepID=A0A7N0UY27_KALFE
MLPLIKIMVMGELPWLYSLSISILLFTPIIFFLVKQIQVQRAPPPPPPPPSPPSVPILGHLYLMKNDVPFQRTLQTLSATYGHVFRLKFGFRSAIVVSSPAAVEDCLVKNDVVFADRPLTRAAKHLNYDSTTMSNASYGDHFRNLRKILNLEIFSASRQSRFLCSRQEEVKMLVKSLFASTRHGFERVEMRSLISEMTLNGILRMISGKSDYGDEGGELRERIKERMGLSAAMSNPADFFPFLRWFDYKSYEKRLVKLKERMDEVLQGMVDQHRKKSSEGSSTDSMIDNLLAMQEAEPASLTDVTIKGLILVLINAGSDTSAITIEWAMSLLLNNPDKLKKARSELEAVIGWHRLVEESDLPNLPYIQCIVNETLRIYPSTPLLLPHQASSDCVIQGYGVKRGTMLLVNAYGLQRDPGVWDEPMRFIPERFENVQEAASHAHKFIPFGVGRRICPGASMASKVVGLALASLIQCFEWGRIGEEEVDMRECPGLTMSKIEPLEVMCRPRDKMLNVLSKLA